MAIETKISSSGSDILVTIFLRGGCDGLNLVGPSADPVYIAERRVETRVERDGDHPGLPLENTLADSDFRFHFKAEKLKSLYDEKHLAIVHACGLTNATRSHFEATDYMERGTPDDKNTPTGWLTRLNSQLHLRGLVPVASITNSLPTSLLACSDAIAIPNVRKMRLQGNARYHEIQEMILKQSYNSGSLLGANGLRALSVVDIFTNAIPHDEHGNPVDYTPLANVTYPGNELGNALKTLAQLIKMDVGVRIATADFGGWDTHVDQNGRFPTLVDALSLSLGAFWDDMKSYQDKLTVVVMSEFGRRLKSNESRGTDHGHGNVMLVLGGKVNGGNILGHWPGLTNEALDNQVDLAITTDYRTVLAEIMHKNYNINEFSTIFPKFRFEKSIGIIQSAA